MERKRIEITGLLGVPTLMNLNSVIDRTQRRSVLVNTAEAMLEETKARGHHCDEEFLRIFMEGESSLDDELTFLVHLGSLQTMLGSCLRSLEGQRRPLLQNGKDPGRTGVLITAST